MRTRLKSFGMTARVPAHLRADWLAAERRETLSKAIYDAAVDDLLHAGSEMRDEEISVLLAMMVACLISSRLSEELSKGLLPALELKKLAQQI